LAKADLPSYSVLVPLRDEAATLPGLTRALDRLIYPRDRLEILLLVEQSDPETVAAARAIDLPPWFRVVVVPDGEPRTKPKAMAYALYLATGDIVTVYDAEDTPDPSQLLLAANTLAGDPALCCVQARLTIVNTHASWLARQFAIEYDVLFSGLLPVLVRWQAPVPLGGTSNHFRRALLQTAGGWDPYNVTEDADIGVRLHRLGHRVAMLASTTEEEAVPDFWPWLRQRTRWMKGWMQTYAVHMASPRRLLREAGWRGFLALQLVLGAPLLSALIHPLFYIMLASEVASGQFMAEPQTIWGSSLMALTTFNLLAGYFLAILLSAVVAVRSGQRVSLWILMTIPAYWLLISVAAYRAAYQLVRQPHLWEKTPHAPRPGSDPI
jgi:cellulose synthase/poly-beta-1,6-N-acetylglucosamine synthase-like glycosyltransferase